MSAEALNFPPELFNTTNSFTGKEVPIRKLNSDELIKIHNELKGQFDEVQAELLDYLNRQLTLARYLAAIEFEQERRKAQGRN